MEGISDVVKGRSSPKHRKDAQTVQACDPCRLRKVRCQSSESVSHAIAAPQRTASSDAAEDESSSVTGRQFKFPCKRCTKHGLECSFLLPVGRRGPKGPRNRRLDSLPDPSSRLSRSSTSTQPDGTRSRPAHRTNSQDLSVDLTSSISPDLRQSRTCSQQSSSIASHHITSPVAGLETGSRQLVGIPHSHPASVLSCSHPSPYEAFTNVQYSTDDLCSRDLLLQMIDDYLEYLYPALPVVHRPTFRASLERKRDSTDKGFLSLLLALCAFTVGCLPRRFEEYQRTSSPIRYRSRLEMIDYCYGKCMQFRGPRYFDEISHTKWAIPCLLYVAYFHAGEHNKSRMIESEAILFARLLGLHRISAYSGLNPIETQLRKKAFWLMFYGYVHLQLQDHRKEKIAFIDCSMLHELHLQDLLPAPQDDEQITETEYLILQDLTPTLTAAFNLRSRLFWTAVLGRSAKDQSTHPTVHCHCTRLQHPELYMEHLHSRIHELKYMLDDAPWYLRQWGSKAVDGRSDELSCPTDSMDAKFFDAQLTTIRADIQITHLWLQSIIMDQADAFSITSSSTSSGTTEPSSKSRWYAREDICHQMLLLLWSIPESSLEALGLYLVYKVRDVAGTLLACPFANTGQVEDVGPATRAREYLRAFTDKLRELDKSETINSLSLQTWVDTDRNQAGKYYYW